MRSAQPVAQRRFARRAERQYTRFWYAPGPSELFEAIEQGGAEHAREMVAPFAPVQARTAEGTTAARLGVLDYTKPSHQRGALWREVDPLRSDGKCTALRQPLVHQHSEFPGQVVIADAGLAQRRLTRACAAGTAACD